MKKLLSLMLACVLLLGGLPSEELRAWARENRGGTLRQDFDAPEWNAEQVQYVGGAVDGSDLQAALANDAEGFSAAYAVLNAAALSSGTAAEWTVIAEGNKAPYIYRFCLYRQELTAENDLYEAVEGSVREGEGNTYTFAIDREGRYMLQIRIEDAEGEFVTVQSAPYETISAADIQKVEEIAARCAGENLSDYDKAANLHDWLCANAVYEAGGSESPSDVLVGGKGTAGAFALAYQMLLTASGVENIYVDGGYEGNAHAWNMVKLDGEWYHVDAALDAAEGDCFYFGLTTELIARDHEIWSVVPAAAAYEHNRILKASDGIIASLGELSGLISRLQVTQDSFCFYYVGEGMVHDEYARWCMKNAGTYDLTGYSYTYGAYTRLLKGERRVDPNATPVPTPEPTPEPTAAPTATPEPDYVKVTHAESHTETGAARVNFMVQTKPDVAAVAIYAEGGALVGQYSGSEHYADSNGVRMWKLSYDFVNEGDRKLTFKALDEAGNTIVSAEYALTVRGLIVSGAAFKPAEIEKGKETTITVKTSIGAEYLMMYAENGKLAKMWKAAESSKISGKERVWTLTFVFNGVGSREMTFKASVDGKNGIGSGKIAKINVLEPMKYDVVGAEFGSKAAYKGDAVALTVKTGVDAKKLMLYAEGNTFIKEWDSEGNSRIEGSVRVWTVKYAFGTCGERQMTLKASVDGKLVGAGKTASITINERPKYDVLSAEFGTKTAYKGDEVALTVKTGVDAKKLMLYAEGGAFVKEWDAAGNAKIEGGICVWTVKYKFSSCGERKMTLKASADGKTVGAGKTAAISIVEKQKFDVLSAEFASKTAYSGSEAVLTVKTGVDAKILAMYAEGGALVKEWPAENSSKVSGNERIWTVKYKFSACGERKMTLKASVDGKSFGAGKTAAITINEKPKGDVLSAEFASKTVYRGDVIVLTVKTGVDAKRLMMYGENGSLAKEWQANANSKLSGNERIWTAQYVFAACGERKMTFKASVDGKTVGASKTASISVIEKLKTDVTSAAFVEQVAYKGESVTLTVKTGVDAKVLTMFAEGGAVAKEWPAEGNSKVNGDVRVWTVKYKFGSAGARVMTLKGSADGKNFGAGKKAEVYIAEGAPAVAYATFAKEKAEKNELVTINALTNADAAELKLYAENGECVKTWKADGNSSVSGLERVWKVQYSFGGTGERQVTFRAGKDGKTTGLEQKAKITITEPSDEIRNASFKESVSYKDECVVMTAETGINVKFLMMYSEAGAIIKKWSANGNSTVEGGNRHWTLQYVFEEAGLQSVEIKGSLNGRTGGKSKKADMVVSAGIPAVGYAAFAKKSAAKGENVTIVVKTNADAAELKMYSEDGTCVKTWKADANSEVNGIERIWNVEYAFGGAGEREVTFKATKNGTKMGYGQSARITIK